MVISAEGVFVPASLFGTSDSLRAEVREGSRGTEVVVYSKPEASRDGFWPGEREQLELEMKWLREHRSEYRGKWVAITGDQLLAVGSSALEVREKARAAGVAVPMIEYMEPEGQLPFAGW